MLVRVLLVPANKLAWLRGMTLDENDVPRVNPRVVQAGPHAGDGILGLQVAADPANEDVSSYLLSLMPGVEIDMDVAFPDAD